MPIWLPYTVLCTQVCMCKVCLTYGQHIGTFLNILKGTDMDYNRSVMERNIHSANKLQILSCISMPLDMIYIYTHTHTHTHTCTTAHTYSLTRRHTRTHPLTEPNVDALSVVLNHVFSTRCDIYCTGLSVRVSVGESVFE